MWSRSFRERSLNAQPVARRKSHRPQQETERVVPLRSGDNEMRSRLMLLLVIAALVVLFVLLAGGPTAAERTTTQRDLPKSERRGRGSQDSRKDGRALDRKSTRLNSSHLGISYAVFCLKK